MTPRLIVNALLLLLLGGLVVLTLYEPKHREQESVTLTPLEPNQIEHIRIKRKDQDSIALERVDQEWEMTEPMAVPALPGKIDRLLKMAAIPSFAHYPLNAAELDRYGLNPPQASLIFNDTRLDFGAVETLSMRRYIRAGDTLHLVDDTFMHHLLGDATDYMDTRLLPEGARISRLTLPGLKLVRQPEKGWTQAGKAINQDPVQVLLDEWRFARALRVERLTTPFNGDDALIAFEDQPGLHLVIDNQPGHLRIANPALGLIYHFSHTKAEKLLQLSSDNPGKTD